MSSFVYVCIGWLACVRLCTTVLYASVYECVYVNAFVLDSMRMNACCSLLSHSVWFGATLDHCLDRDNHRTAYLYSTNQIQNSWLCHTHTLLHCGLFSFVCCLTHDTERVVFGSNKNRMKQHNFVNAMKRAKYINATENKMYTMKKQKGKKNIHMKGTRSQLNSKC